MPVADKSKWSPKTFRSIDELSAEIDRIETAHQAGMLSTAGGWTPGQCMSHTAVFIKSSYDGFELGAPWILRAVCSLLLKPVATKPKSQMKPGIKLPAKAKELLPEDAVSVEEGIAQMRTQIARIKSGEQMTQVSPLLGKMSHQQWVNLHLNHCRMHYGFFSYE